MTITLYIDPSAGDPTGGDPSGGDDSARNLFPSDGEFVLAMRGLRHRTIVPRAVPDAVFLELYAYELLERAREFEPVGGDQVWRIPFSTEALFAAADLQAHAGRELASMLPAFDRVVVAIPSTETLVAESTRVLGAVRFDPERYIREVTDLVALRGWEVDS